MSAAIINFPEKRSRAVATARAARLAAAKCGWHISFEECLEIYQESQHLQLSDHGKAVARDIARQLGITLKPE